MILQRWARKPPPGARLNGANPLTVGLCGWSALEGAGSVVRNALPFDHLSPINSAGWAMGPEGPVLSFDAASAHAWQKTSLSRTLHGSAAATMAIRYKPTSLSTGGTNDYIMSFSTGGGGGNGFDFRQNDGNLLFDIATSGSDTVGPFSQPLTTEWHTAVLVFNGSDAGGTSYAFYHDGRLATTDFINIFATSTLDVSDNEVSIGDFGSVAHAYWSGQVAWAYYWPAVLTSQHARLLHERPYDLFAARQMYWDVPTAVVAGGQPTMKRWQQVPFMRLGGVSMGHGGSF